MALTKVSGGILDPGINVAGIVTATGFDGPFTGGSSKNITAGIITATGFDLNGNGDISGNLVIGGNLTANGDFTTLNTTLREVEILRVDANSSEPAGIITQTGAGDLLRLYDGTSQVVTVDDTGNVGLGSAIPAAKLDVNGNVKFAGTTSGRDLNWNYGANKLNLADNVLFGLGNSDDLLIHHTGSTGYIKGQTGNLYIQSDQVVVIGNQTDSSAGLKFTSGGAAELFHNNNLRLATTAQGINVSRVGGVSQIGISQTTTTANSINGTISFINSSNTTAQIQGRTGAASTTGDILFLCNTVGDESLAILEDGKVRVPDRGRFVVGTGNDLSLYHDNGGSGSHIENSGSNLTVRTTGTYLYIHGNNVHLRSQTGNETMLTAVVNSAVSLYYDASTYSTAKLQTTATGVQIDTILKLNGAAGNPGKLQLQEGGALSEIRVERSTDTSSALLFGTEISGTTATRWKIDTAGHFIPSAAATYNIGSASAEIGDLFIADDKKVQIGSSQDLQIYHTTSGTSWIRHTNSSEYFILEGNQMDFRDYATGVYRARMGAAVQLYYNGNNEKFRTTNTGISVTGEVATSQDYPTIRPTLDFNFAAEKKLDPRITYQRTGPASFVNGFGKVVLVGDNAPRFDHDPLTGESKGLLIEESRTNIIYPSSNWSSTYWTYDNSNSSQEPFTTDTEDPAETFNATKIIPTQGNTNLRDVYWKTTFTFTNGVNLTMSIFAKSTTGLHVQLRPRGQGSGKAWATFNLTTGVVGNSGGSTLVSTKIEKYPNDWYRCSLTFTGGGDASGTFGALIMDDGNDGEAATHSGDASKSIFYWGAQFETGSFATSYIPTYGSAATRGNESFEIDGEDFTDFYNTTEGTVLSHITPLDGSLGNHSGTGGVVWSFDAGGGFANGHYFSNANSTTAFGHSVVVGSSGQNTGGGTGNQTNGVPFKNATIFKKDDFIMATNGTLASADTSGNLPTVVKLMLGNNGWGNALNAANIHFNRFAYYPKRLPNTQLVTLTS